MFVNNRSAYSRINIEFQILLSTRKFFWRKYSAISQTPYLGENLPVLSLICWKNRSAYRRINTVVGNVSGPVSAQIGTFKEEVTNLITNPMHLRWPAGCNRYPVPGILWTKALSHLPWR